jgi:hypothetical protein
MQLIGSGQVGKQAASAIRHVAAQNGVWSLGDFGGFPPRSAMTNGDSVPSAVGQSTNVSNASSEQSDNAESSSTDSPSVAAPAASANNQLMKDIGDHDYRFVFNSCAIGMVSGISGHLIFGSWANILLCFFLCHYIRRLRPWAAHSLTATSSSYSFLNTTSKKSVD